MVDLQRNVSSDNSEKLVIHWLLRSPIWVIAITIVVAVSYEWNRQTIEQHALSLAMERGRYTFTIIEATRLWVARHGVAYVVRSEKTPSNPYLEIDEKDFTSPLGKDLTAINPAYMTRQLTEILKNKHELYVHLTSLKPINPDNKSDTWESRALEKFENDLDEVIEIVDNGEKDIARYMAPLFVKPACMKCHEKQGYEVGDVRGGVSVSFDYAPFQASIADHKMNINIIHIVAWLVLVTFTMVTLRLIRRHEETIEKARDDAELLVVERTRELQQALDEIQTLKGIIPICSYCHKIRDDEGAWERLESYLTKHSDASFSHGICPDCAKKVRKDEGLNEE